MDWYYSVGIRTLGSALMKKFNVYLDDVREGYNNSHVATHIGWEDWVVVRHIDHVKTLLKAGLVDKMSLDYDMGFNSYTGEENPNGKALLKWMIENDIWPEGFITVHSANPCGARDMRELVEKHNRQRTD